MAFGGVDPAQVGASVELGEGVEERAGPGVGVECRGDVVGEVGALGTFGFDVDVNGVADGEAAVAEPGGAEVGPVPFGGGFDGAAYPYAVDCAANAVAGLGAPNLVGVERYRDRT
jgi:hypothetical protein